MIGGIHIESCRCVDYNRFGNNMLHFIILIVIGLYLYFIDRSAKATSCVRNYPVIGRARYLFETIGPELRQYLFDNDTEG